RSATPNDLAIVYISGHGWPEGRDDFYLAPSEFDVKSPSVFGISKGEIQERLKNLPSKVLVFLDACYSGSALPQLMAKKSLNNSVEKVVADFRDAGSGLFMIASSTSGQESYEIEKFRHGAMALAVVEALSGFANDVSDARFLE